MRAKQLRKLHPDAVFRVGLMLTLLALGLTMLVSLLTQDLHYRQSTSELVMRYGLCAVLALWCSVVAYLGLQTPIWDR